MRARYARCHTSLAEVEKTLRSHSLRRKYRYSDEAIERHLRDIRIFSERAEPDISLQECPDASDNEVLTCAVYAHADFLVTRNTKHFPKHLRGVTVIAPKEFLSLTSRKA